MIDLLHLLYGLSPTTLKRFWGYLKNEEVQTRLYTLDVLARFVDLPLWQTEDRVVSL
jgi:hypothetical protein